MNSEAYCDVGLLEDPLFTDIIAAATINVVCANQNFITDNGVVKILRGLSTSQGKVKTKYDGLFNLIPEKIIFSIIDKLEASGYLTREWRQGDWGDFTVLKPTERGANFNLVLFDREKIKESMCTGEIDYEDAFTPLDNIQSMSKTLLEENSKTAQSLLQYVIDTPAAYCYDKDTIATFLNTLPEAQQEFIRVSYNLENDRGQRKYLKSLLELFDEKMMQKAQRAAAQKKERDTGASGIKPKAKKQSQDVDIVPWKNNQRGETRWVVKDSKTGRILDDAQGWGYKTKQKAAAAWSYKNRSAKTKQQEEAARRWLRQHKSFSRWMDIEAFYNLKDTGGHEALTVALAKEMLEREGFDVKDLDFSVKTLITVWSRG